MPPFMIEKDLNYYGEQLVAHFALVFGEGFLSPGGPKEVGEIVRDLDLRGKQVLDIGCGIGGPAIVLADTFGASRVTSIDIQPVQIERATQHIEKFGLGDRIFPTLVLPGPLPFEDNSFDVVFSKEAINEVSDKEAMFREMFRVLKPGGWLAMGDWLKGDGELSELFHVWEKSMNLPIKLEQISNVHPMLEACGFEDISLRFRNDWYRKEAQVELLRSIGPLHGQLLAIQKDERVIELAAMYWTTMIRLLDTGEFRPSHIRAQKPIS